MRARATVVHVARSTAFYEALGFERNPMFSDETTSCMVLTEQVAIMLLEHAKFDEFLVGDHDFGRYVVHGHTPRLLGGPELRPNRANLDTGAVYGGRLTAAIFTDGRAAPVGILQVPA